jgi:hypothetical protein
MSYSKNKNREAKRRTHLYNASITRQPTLESFGFHICDKIRSPAHAKLASDTLDSQTSTCYPFVKWAGGKRQLLWQLYPLARTASAERNSSTLVELVPSGTLVTISVRYSMGFCTFAKI